MDKFGIKGTLYDLLGYAIPGVTFIAGLVILILCQECAEKKFLMENIVNIKIGVSFFLLVLIASYILGHVFASISSWLFERRGKNLSPKNRYEMDPKQVGEKFQASYEKIFGTESKMEFRNVIAYSEEKTKAVYDTAFVFLAIYGFSRNTSIALFFVLIVYFIILDHAAWNMWIVSGIILAIIALLHNYFRFREYYVKQIYASLEVPLE